jgi:oligopeptide transport system substrate-binding protein
MAPFKGNLALREALAHAIDREQLVEVALGGLGAPATTFLPPGMPAYNKDLNPFQYDPVLAKQKLAEAGYPDGKGFPKLDILIRADTENQKVFEFVQSQLKQNLNIDVNLNAVPAKTYSAMKNDPNQRPPMFRNSMGADYPDPQEFLEYFGLSSSGQDQEEFSNPQFDQLIQQADKSTSQDERISLYQQAEKLYLADIPIVPLYYGTASYLLDGKFTGFGFSPLYLKPLAEVKPAS